jgi:hypothetical protein
MAIPYIAFGTLIFLGSIFTLIAVFSLLRRLRAARLTRTLAQNAAVGETTTFALIRPENDVPTVLPFIASDPYDDTQPIFSIQASQTDFIPIVEGVDEEPTQPAPLPRRVIQHDPDLPSITIEPDGNVAHPQRANVARLIAFFKEEKVETAS